MNTFFGSFGARAAAFRTIPRSQVTAFTLIELLVVSDWWFNHRFEGWDSEDPPPSRPL
jgi:hypothetical protein